MALPVPTVKLHPQLRKHFGNDDSSICTARVVDRVTSQGKRQRRVVLLCYGADGDICFLCETDGTVRRAAPLDSVKEVFLDGDLVLLQWAGAEPSLLFTEVSSDERNEGMPEVLGVVAKMMAYRGKDLAVRVVPQGRTIHELCNFRKGPGYQSPRRKAQLLSDDEQDVFVSPTPTDSGVSERSDRVPRPGSPWFREPSDHATDASGDPTPVAAGPPATGPFPTSPPSGSGLPACRPGAPLLSPPPLLQPDPPAPQQRFPPPPSPVTADIPSGPPPPAAVPALAPAPSVTTRAAQVPLPLSTLPSTVWSRGVSVATIGDRIDTPQHPPPPPEVAPLRCSPRSSPRQSPSQSPRTSPRAAAAAAAAARRSPPPSPPVRRAGSILSRAGMDNPPAPLQLQHTLRSTDSDRGSGRQSPHGDCMTPQAELLRRLHHEEVRTMLLQLRGEMLEHRLRAASARTAGRMRRRRREKKTEKSAEKTDGGEAAAPDKGGIAASLPAMLSDLREAARRIDEAGGEQQRLSEMAASLRRPKLTPAPPVEEADIAGTIQALAALRKRGCVGLAPAVAWLLSRPPDGPAC